MRLPFVKRKDYEEVVYKLECLLCCATDGKLSKHTYSLETMEVNVTDSFNETYTDGYNDGIKEFAERLTDRICNKSDESLDNPDGSNYFIPDVLDDIDNFKKEMVGDAE